MRLAIAAFAVLTATSLIGDAKADPYRWCADYGGAGRGGGTHCYFVTLEQCRAATGGKGGFSPPTAFSPGAAGPGRGAPRSHDCPGWIAAGQFAFCCLDPMLGGAPPRLDRG